MAIPTSLVRRAVTSYLLKRAYCASFELTYNCNARCQHCHRGTPVPNERLASPQQLLQICRDIQPIVAVMSGGEPLVRKELTEIVRLFREAIPPLRIQVNTNAALLTPKRFDALLEAGLSNFIISFDFPDERHDEWRAIPGLFRRIEGLIAGLSPADKKRVVLTSVFQRKNFRDAPRMADVAREWGVSINFSAYTWLRTHDMDLLIPPDEMGEFREVVDLLLEKRRESGHVLTSAGVFDGMIQFFDKRGMGGCLAGERLLVVNPDGTYSPCGLHIRDYATRGEMIRDFTRTNTCSACYTSSRAMAERPGKSFFLEHVHHFRRA
ncbi:MAG TPA: radical SAM protein [Longimicrobiales bacterium]|nr:radical SAM protein [Longimicrobiales bacterium]